MVVFAALLSPDGRLRCSRFIDASATVVGAEALAFHKVVLGTPSLLGDLMVPIVGTGFRTGPLGIIAFFTVSLRLAVVTSQAGARVVSDVGTEAGTLSTALVAGVASAQSVHKIDLVALLLVV